MFKSWGKNKSSYEPKTPKLSSVSLPDERYTPISAHTAYMEKPRGTSFFRRRTHDTRAMTPMLDAWNPPHHDHPSGRSRPRTLSTPVRDVEAPRPIRPHPSQGPFIPVIEHSDRLRNDFPRTLMAPVGVPSAAFLEDQIRRQRAEARTHSHSQPPVDMLLTRSDYEHPEEKRAREVAKRTGATVSRHLSKAWLDEVEEQKKQAQVLKAPSAPPLRKSRTKSWVGDQDEKKPVDFDSWKAVPLEMGPVKPITEVDPKAAPLKSALKKTSSIKPPAVNREQKGAKGYYSEDESERKKEERFRSIRVSKIPSKAFLEEQQERLEESRNRSWSSVQYVSSKPPATASVHDIRPILQNTHSSSTGSPTESINAPYDRNLQRNRSRHGSFSEQHTPVIPSNYMPAYIKEDALRNHRASVHRGDPATTHGVIAWPLVDFHSRKREGHPLIYFDVAFNPCEGRYPLKAKRGPHYSPLTREELEMPMCLGVYAPEVLIVNRKLQSWPVHINLDRAVRVIDVFKAIYESYGYPLMQYELVGIGPEYIQRCQRSFKQRCEDSADFTHNEERRGMRRVDLLRGRRIFKGLVPIAGKPFNYELIFDEGT